jgi:tRNA(Ile)-lysidine synthase
MALLWLANAAFPGKVLAATVDHRLRREARDEARMVADYCAQAVIDHAILTPSEPIIGNLQSAAREARYRLLEDWRSARGIGWLMTAHHADDQAETLMMRLNRGSGVGGLAGVRANNGAIIRPLLGWRRADLAELVGRHDIPHVHDPSNDDLRFDRVAMRRSLVDATWLDPLSVAKSASALAEAETAIVWMTEQLAAEYIRQDGRTVQLIRHDFPGEIVRRLLLKMLTLAGFNAPPRGSTLDQALAQLSHGHNAMIGNWLITGGKHWVLRRAPARK